MSIFKLKKYNNHGFTLIEVLVVAPLIILLIGAFISAIISMTGSVIASKASGNLTLNIQDTLNQIDTDVKFSKSYLATNSVTLTSPQGYNDDTTDFKNVGTNGNMLILESNATTSNPLNSGSSPIYQSNQPNACNSPLVTNNTSLLVNIIYFVKNNVLWRRVILPGNYASVSCVNGAIGNPWQRPSCAPSINDAFCKAQDQRLVDGVQSGAFDISYYTAADSVNPIVNATSLEKTDNERLTALQTAGSVRISITANNTYAGHDVTQSASIRSGRL